MYINSLTLSHTTNTRTSLGSFNSLLVWVDFVVFKYRKKTHINLKALTVNAAKYRFTLDFSPQI